MRKLSLARIDYLVKGVTDKYDKGAIQNLFSAGFGGSAADRFDTMDIYMGLPFH
jgi:hypothetical protein